MYSENLIKQSENRWKKSLVSREVVTQELDKFSKGKEVNWRRLDSSSRIRRRLERLGDHFAAEALVDGDHLTFNPYERIINSSQLQGVQFLERGLIAARSVARVAIRNSAGTVVGFGSGLMISPRLFMTNNHVLADVQTASISTIQFEYVNSAAGPRELIEFQLRPDQFFVTDDRLDFTLVSVQEENAVGDQLAARGWSPLIAGSGKVIVGERVNILQHPAGERMQIATRENTVVHVIDDFLQYVADTRRGSSGGPVFSDQWELAAVHHSGVPERDASGNILMRNGEPFTYRPEDEHRISWIANEGIRISSIVAFVRSLSLGINENQLFEEAFVAPALPDLWRLMARRTRGGLQESDGLTFAADQDAEGNPSWLFRLSFGPGSSQKSQPASAGDITAAPAKIVDMKPSEKPTVDTIRIAVNDNTSEKETAQRLFERYRHEGTYYDEAADQAVRDNYWREIDLEKCQESLFRDLTHHLEVTHSPRHSYSVARHQYLYPSIDLHEDGMLKNIYSGNSFSPVEAIAAELAAIAPVAQGKGYEANSYTLTSLVGKENLWDELEEESALPFNCEHVVCQSWFDKRNPMKSDLHHLFACEPDCNSFRSNIPYWQFPQGEEAYREACGRREGKKFEPAHNKGVVARATMYFLVRYPGLIGERDSEFTKDRVHILLDWHRQNPVSIYEYHRNWLIQKAQGNRNPFIDFPQLARKKLLKKGF